MKNRLSLFAIIVSVGIVGSCLYHFSIWESFPIHKNTGGDAFGYYIYNPAFFVYHDVTSLKKTFPVAVKCDGRTITPTVNNFLGYGDATEVNSNQVIKYTMGVAILQAPFFLIAHALATVFTEDADGFSSYYTVAILFSQLFYLCLALLFLRVVLLRYFEDSEVATILFLIPTCTSVFYMCVFQLPLSHVYLLFLYAVLMWAIEHYFAFFKTRNAVFIGGICGLIAITRANELYVVLIPICYGLFSIETFTNRIGLLLEKWKHVIIVVASFLLAISPQILYWKVASGHFVFDSYQNEHFDFLHPKILAGLFGFANGWIAYTPVMLLAVFGLFFLWKKKNPFAFSVIIFLIVHVYVIYSWWCWFYMGSFGSRPMVETYALLSIPLGHSISWLYKRTWTKAIALAFIFCCFLLNVSQSYQQHNNFFISEAANWRYVLSMIGKNKMSHDCAVLYDTREFQPHNTKLIRVLSTQNFEDTTEQRWKSGDAFQGKCCLRIPEKTFAAAQSFSLSVANPKSGQWIKASLQYKVHGWPSNLYEGGMFVMEFFKNGESVKWRAIRPCNKLQNEQDSYSIWHAEAETWGYTWFYSQIPNGADEVRVYFWNEQGPEVSIDDVEVSLCEAE